MLCATATSEATCTMVDNEESRRLMKVREDMIAGSKPQMVFRNDDVRLFGGMMLPRANGAPRVNTDGWDNMVVCYFLHMSALNCADADNIVNGQTAWETEARSGQIHTYARKRATRRPVRVL